MNMDIEYNVPQHLLKKADQTMLTNLYKLGDYIRNCTACSQFISYRSIYFPYTPSYTWKDYQ